MGVRDRQRDIRDLIRPLLSAEPQGGLHFGLRRRRGPTHIGLPTSVSPTLLLPRHAARPAAAALRNHTEPRSFSGRLKLGAAATLTRMGALHLVTRGMRLGGADTFLAHLSSQLGRDDFAVSVHLGPPRVNRKPVLRLMDDSGAAFGFVKIGVNPLTCERVRDETSALKALEAAETPGLVTPKVLAAGNWRGNEYLVLSPLDTTGPAPSPDSRRRARRSLAAAFSVAAEPLAESAWWKQLWRRLEECDRADPDAQRVYRAASELRRVHGATTIAIGAGHGDWTPWNTRESADGLVAWDWERFSLSKPLEWDEIHYEISACSKGIAAGMWEVLDGAREGIDRESPAVATIAAYLIDRGTNFVADQHQRAGSPNGPLGTWLLPVLEAAVALTDT